MKIKLKLMVSALIIIGNCFILFGCYQPSAQKKENYDFQTFQTPFKVTLQMAQKVNLFVQKFSDVRGNIEDNVIGEASVGLFDKSSLVIIEDGVIELSTKTLREAFFNAGFNVVEEQKNADLVFKGRINEFWVQESLCEVSHFYDNTGCRYGWSSEFSVADVELDVAFIDRIHGECIWFNVKKSHVKSKPDTIDTTHQNVTMLKEALNNVVNSILTDAKLHRALNNFIRSKDQF